MPVAPIVTGTLDDGPISSARSGGSSSSSEGHSRGTDSSSGALKRKPQLCAQPPNLRYKQGRGKFAILSRRALRSGGSEAAVALIEGLEAPPAGPTSLRDLLQWPQRHCSSLWDGPQGELRRARAESCLQHGVVLHTDYSGQMCAETALRMQLRSMGKHGAVRIDERSLTSYRACDNSKLCQSIMASASHPPLHLFASMLDQIPRRHADALASMRPPSYKGKASGAEEEARRLAEAGDAYKQQQVGPEAWGLVLGVWGLGPGA